MKNWRKKWFLVISLTGIILYFFFAYQQNYTRTTELYLSGLEPTMIYHSLALLFAAISCIFWWLFIVANPIKQDKSKEGG